MELNFLNVTLFLGISQGVFLAITLSRIKTNKNANKLLALLLLLASVMLVTRIILIKSQSVIIFQRLSLIEPVIYLYGPLAFRYVRLLIQKEQARKIEWVRFLPAFIYMIFILYLNILPSEMFAYNINNGDFFIPFLLAEGLALALNIYYWILSIRFLSHYHKQKQQYLSFDQKALKLIRICQNAMGVLLLFWILGFVDAYFLGLNYFLFGYNVIWVALSLLIYVIGFFAIYQPEIFKIERRDNVSQNNSGSSYKRLQENEILELKEKLDQLVFQDNVFLENDLTLANLAPRLNTTSNNLSWLLNNVYNTNFYNFINELRIREFIKKVENKEHVNHTLLALSMEVGFNSKSTFNKAFKTIRNQTPSSFIKTIKVN